MANMPSSKNSLLARLFKKDPQQDQNFFQQGDQDTLLSYYASLAVYHPDLIIVLSLDGEIILQNKDSIIDFLGYSSSNISDYKELFSDKQLQTIQASFAKAKKGKPDRHEVIVQHQNSHTLYLTLTFIPIKKGNTEVEGVFLIAQDHTAYMNTVEALEIKEQHLSLTQQIAKIGSWEYIVDEDKFFCSDSFYQLFGMEKSKIPKLADVLNYIHSDDYQATEHAFQQAIQTGVDSTLDFRINHGLDHDVRFIKGQIYVVRKENEPRKLVGVLKDYTSQRQLEMQDLEMQKQLRHIYDHLHVGIWIKEYHSWNVSYISKGAADILQIPLDKLLNDKMWEEMIHPADREEVFNKRKLLKNGDTIIHKYRVVCGDGTVKWLYDQTVPWFNEQGELTHLFGMFTDITSEIKIQDQLEHYATHNPITALPNKRSLYDKLEQLTSKQDEFALLYLDLDRFALINDSLGHHIGDITLNKIAQKLRSLSSKDVYIANLSNNDFIIIVKHFTTRELVFKLAEAVIEIIDEPLLVEDFELHVTTSIGISFYPEDGKNNVDLIASAHAALYRAKKMGIKNIQLYSPSRDIQSYKKFILENDMRKAIENGEFELYYQPQVKPTTGIIQAAEALIRWNHEEWGVVEPSEFISLAEENHLINPIGDWIIRTVCKQLRTWRELGYTIRPISINISPIRFMKQGLVELVKSQLAIHDLDPTYLQFEITENSHLKRDKHVLATLTRLRELGIKIAIDDFGTGYASFTYLRDFPVDIIKIDKKFIQSIQSNNKKDTAIVSSIIHLANGLDLSVIAEGVEEAEQLDFLKQNDCDGIQGYLFSKPVPTDTFTKMLKTGYLKPTKSMHYNIPTEEKRNAFRLQFSAHILGEVSITHVNGLQVTLGKAKILIENISAGGLKFLTPLVLPLNSTMKFRFFIDLIGESLELDGTLIWKNEAKRDTFYYGAKFIISAAEEDRLAGIINKMSVLRNLNQPIPDTTFIHENPFTYLQKNNQ